MTSLLIVDDHPVFRRGLVALLRASGFDIVGEAASVAEAIAVAIDRSPDVVVMDLGLADGSGITATASIRAARPATRVVVVTMYDDDGSVRAALDAGASGYVVKDASAEEVVAAVRAAEMGASLLGSGIAVPLAAESFVRPEPLAEFGFTPRERELVGLLGKGLSNPVMAERMGVSAKTVANYLTLVLVKLGAADRGQAIEMIRRQTR